MSEFAEEFERLIKQITLDTAHKSINRHIIRHAEEEISRSVKYFVNGPGGRELIEKAIVEVFATKPVVDFVASTVKKCIEESIHETAQTTIHSDNFRHHLLPLIGAKVRETMQNKETSELIESCVKELIGKLVSQAFSAGIPR